jgi:S1-C subfamily serine protease
MNPSQGESVIPQFKKTLLVVAAFALTACATGQQQDTSDASANSVKITNVEGNHGGTGIILRSSPTSSIVLTNSHVCGVVEEGGLVSGRAGTFMVTEYKKSEMHDLCLIRVSGDLMGRTKLSDRQPVPYKEVALISGHPQLYPNVKTVGHFSGRQHIEILMGFTPCTDADFKDDDKAGLCELLGGLPIIKEFDSVLVTATIMPGSSGSAVYNSDMELSGVVFAGSGNLGYAWTVPYEYVKNFLTREAKTLQYVRPTNTVNLFQNKSGSRNREMTQRLDIVCNSPEKAKIKKLCEILDSSMLK